MEWVRFWLSAVSLVLGVSVFFIGIFGIFRFKFVLNRMHAAALLDTMGLLLVVVSLVIAKGWNAISGKMLLIVLFLWLTSPISSHLIAKMEFLTDRNLKDELENDPDSGKEDDHADDI